MFCDLSYGALEFKGAVIPQLFDNGDALFLFQAAGMGAVIAEDFLDYFLKGLVADTIIHALASVLQQLSASVTAVGMLVVQTIMNFLIPSGSGQTVVTMPIMAPLAELVGVTRQTAVLGLQYGDGFSNIFYPVSGYFMATLALGT